MVDANVSQATRLSRYEACDVGSQDGTQDLCREASRLLRRCDILNGIGACVRLPGRQHCGMPKSELPHADSVRSLDRGLRLLQAMNRSPHASITQLAREVGIPRSTTYRLLDTLVAAGMVASLGGIGYCLTREVRTLSDGFLDEAWIEAAWVEMLRLSAQLIWPISLFTPEAPTMVIRRTTHELSSLSIDYGMSGRRMPIAETAAGRVYLAFCPEAERRLILDMPGTYAGTTGRLDREILEQRLALISARGFETRFGGIIAKTGSLSVPILRGRRVLGSMSLVFIAAGFDPDRAIAEFEAPMKAAAARIGAAT